MNKAILMIGGGVCLLFALFSGCGENPGEKEYEKALASWKKNDLVRAQSQMEKAIRKLTGNEDKSVANNQLGIIRWRLGKQGQAIESFGESCRLSNNLTDANLNLGVALYHAGQLEQARLELTKILNEKPENATARIYLGLVYMKQQDWQNASRELTAGLRASPNNAAGQNALALVELHTSRNSDAAVKRLKQLLAAYPDYAPALFNLAIIHEQWLRNPAAALGWYKQYLQKAGDKGAQVEPANQAVARLSREGSAAPRTVQEPETDPDAAAQYLAQGTKLHAARKYSDAVKQYERAIKADPAMVDAYYNLGLSRYEMKEYREAARACSDALKLNPNYTHARYMLALSYAQLKEWNNAEREAGVLKESDPAKAETVLEYVASQR